jgi:hypothetical protein
MFRLGVKNINADYRFRARDNAPQFRRITLLVDGVPLYMKGGDMYFNAKKQRKYLSIIVYTAVDGVPLAYTGPFIGRRHDSRAIRHRPPKVLANHYRWELIGADGAFVSCAHCVVPFDRKELRTKDNNVTMRRYNKWHSKIRSRIERRFGYLNRHALMSSRVGYRPLLVVLLWRALWNLESYKLESQLESNTDCTYRDYYTSDSTDSEDVCDCCADGSWKAGAPSISARRHEITSWRKRTAKRLKRAKAHFDPLIRAFRCSAHASSATRGKRGARIDRMLSEERDWFDSEDDEDVDADYEDVFFPHDAFKRPRE